MYVIYVNGQPLHHPNMEPEKCVATSAQLREEVNTHGSLDIQIEPSNPRWGWLSKHDPVKVFADDVIIWAGRIATIDQDLYGSQLIHCEGKLAYLCDSFIEPFSFRGTPANLLQAFITKHNQAMGISDVERTLSRGTVTVTDPNDAIYRYNESSQSVWDAIQDHLVGSSLGGYILFDPVTNEVGYYSGYARVCSQEIRFGINLKECGQTEDGTDIVNVLYAFGAQYDPAQETVPDGDGYHVWGGNRLHLTGADWPLVHQSAASVGRFYGTRVWDDITTVEALKRAALAYLDENFAETLKRRIQVKAVDMSISDRELPAITVGALCPVVPPNLSGIDKNGFSNAVQLMCAARDLNIVDPSESVFSFGTVEATLSAIVGGG